MYPNRNTVRSLIIITLLASCGAKEKVVIDPTPTTNTQVLNSDTTPQIKPAKSIEIMTYNVHNLFDVEHDVVSYVEDYKGQGTEAVKDKNDWQFVPLSHPGKEAGCKKLSSAKYLKYCLETDWTEDKLELKLKQIKKAILEGREKMPAVLAIQEVENEKVVSRLAAELGYKHFQMTTSPDKRGIDVALLYNTNEDISYKSHAEYELKRSGDNIEIDFETRNFLEVELEIFGQSTFFYVSHWPSQSAKGKQRLNVARALRRNFIDKRLEENKNNHIIVLGDFNTTTDDEYQPFKLGLLPGKGLTNDDSKNLFDLSTIHENVLKFMKKNDPDRFYSLPKMANGSYFYKRTGSWNLLDRFFISKNFLDNKGLSVGNYYIHSPKLLTRKLGGQYKKGVEFGATIVDAIPFEYDHNSSKAEEAGFSDHYPVVMRLDFYQ